MVQLNLPDTLPTDDGPIVEGAGAALLRDLLSAFDEETERRGGSNKEQLQDGLSEDEIRTALGAIGLTPPDELVVWWGWHNGIRPGKQSQSRWEQRRLDDSVQIYRQQLLGTGVGEWNPNWLRFAGPHTNHGWSVSCAPDGFPPLVRATDPVEATTQPEETRFQVVSLCTPVTWWLTGITEGWSVWNEKLEFWETDLTKFPMEWRATDIL